MKNAVVGLVLLMCVYLILFIVNPELTTFEGLRLESIEHVILDQSTGGNEGVGTSSASLASLPEKCKNLVNQAKSDAYQSCNISGGFSSPTGGGPVCGEHHWGDDGAKWDYKNFSNKGTGIDFGAAWGSPIKAPFDGVVTYEKQTDISNRCGNRIYLKNSKGSITICHAKDFLDSSGNFQSGKNVSRGDVIGHVGGNCCAGEAPPSTWSSGKNGWCNKSGTACTDPTKNEDCGCQPVEQAGNTSGPHVHLTWSPTGGNLLKCLQD